MSQISLILRLPRINPNEFVTSSTVTRLFWHRNKSTKSSSSSSSSSSSDSSSDDELSRKKNKNGESIKKLNTLLQQMIQDDVVNSASSLKLAQPPKRIKPNLNKNDEKNVSPKEKISSAVKSVAESLGGNVKQTESELLQKLLLPVDSDVQAKNLSDVIKGMKIDREPKPELSRADQVKKLLQVRTDNAKTSHTQRRPPRMMPKQYTPIVAEKIDLFGSEPLGIFTDKSKLTVDCQNKTWHILEERDMRLAVTHPPANYFQQMILWTEQGKLWKFPINNEQGLEEESKVYFAEHVFLEEHLDPWCPEKGPIRHFMELVCVGLSKNPYLTVQAKREHIEWYKNYFEDKKKLLQEVGAFPLTERKGESPKAIEK